MTRADALRPMHRSVLETHQRARGYRPRPVNMSTSWNTNAPRTFYERDVAKWREKPPMLATREEQKAARAAVGAA